jgi:ABC-2 type transport system ATP-binding protein
VVENTTTKKLLSWLSEEIIILNTKDTQINIPEDLVKQYQAKHLEEHEVEVTISKQHSLNSLFELLNKNNIELTSFRNKTNRLEALFMKITQ